MNREEFAITILRGSKIHWNSVLQGKRNLGYKKAKIVSQLFNTSIEIWLDPERQPERMIAWEKFSL